MPKPIPHGTNNGYRNYGCRCDECKVAGAEYGRAEYLRNREHKRAWAKDYRQTNPTVFAALHERRREPMRLYLRDYYAKNKAELLAKQRAYRDAHKDQRVANARRWIVENIEQHRAYQRRYQQARRIYKQSLPTYEVTERDWRRLLNRYDNRCAYCGKPRKLTMDHVVPVLLGGQHSIGNLLPACGPCNSSKGPKLLTQWRLRRS